MTRREPTALELATRGEARLRASVTERQVETAADTLMASFGFTVWKLSQPRATMQTPGWPDRRYTRRDRGLALWVELKRPRGGRQSAAQQTFQADCDAAGEVYLLCPTTEPLQRYLVAHGLAREIRPGYLQRLIP